MDRDNGYNLPAIYYDNILQRDHPRAIGRPKHLERQASPPPQNAKDGQKLWKSY